MYFIISLSFVVRMISSLSDCVLNSYIIYRFHHYPRYNALTTSSFRQRTFHYHHPFYHNLPQINYFCLLSCITDLLSPPFLTFIHHKTYYHCRLFPARYHRHSFFLHIHQRCPLYHSRYCKCRHSFLCTTTPTTIIIIIITTVVLFFIVILIWSSSPF